MVQSKFHILYSDIGGVLGTNGWGTDLRLKVATHFNVESEETESRHAQIFDTYERGFMTFEEYLNYVYFASPRLFKMEQLRDYAYDASTLWTENLDFLRSVKKANGLKLGLISNEGGGLSEHRSHKFGLRDLADFIIYSYASHMRKPDPAIWRLALNLAQATPHESIYIDDRKIFADIAKEKGFTAFHYTSLENLRRDFADAGLIVPHVVS